MVPLSRLAYRLLLLLFVLQVGLQLYDTARELLVFALLLAQRFLQLIDVSLRLSKLNDCLVMLGIPIGQNLLGLG